MSPEVTAAAFLYPLFFFAAFPFSELNDLTMDVIWGIAEQPEQKSQRLWWLASFRQLLCYQSSCKRKQLNLQKQLD